MLQRTTFLAPTHLAPLSWRWRLGLLVLAILAIALPVLIVATTPRIVISKPVRAGAQRIVPSAEVPPVEPLKLVDLAPQDARLFNATVPFSTAPNPAARPFNIDGTEADRERAVDCLAAAVYYEAGDDVVGQQAVAQVVINRVRHPAFPKSVCSVVFQGAERRTGCQFTFTCDGAMVRYRPSPAAWDRARFVARQALTGRVERKVGHATHYHTDWVVPYWSASLDKIVEVKTHLFFRWTGWWGTPPAFNRRYAGAEPGIAQLAGLSIVHGDSAVVDPALTTAETLGSLDGAELPNAAQPADENIFLVTLDRQMNGDALAALAIRTCGDRPFCKFMGWTDARRTPKSLPISDAAIDAMSFSYLRNQAIGYGKALWNCDEFQRPSPVQCMRRGVPARVPIVVTIPPQPRGTPPAELTGVRRKGDLRVNAPPVARPTPTPSPTTAPAG